MEVTGLQWLVTILIIAGLLAFDFVFHVRKAHEPSVKEAAIWSSIYIGIAMLFGLYIFVTNGPSAATEFYAGYITEEALSVDNLSVSPVRISRRSCSSVSSSRSWRAVPSSSPVQQSLTPSPGCSTSSAWSCS